MKSKKAGIGCVGELLIVAMLALAITHWHLFVVVALIAGLIWLYKDKQNKKAIITARAAANKKLNEDIQRKQTLGKISTLLSDISAQKAAYIEATTPKKKLIEAFKVSGVTHYDLTSAVDFARKNMLFDPYEGYDNDDIKESPEEEFSEVDLSDALTAIKFVKELDNKYDPDAVSVTISIDDTDFKIGYVPKSHNVNVARIMKARNDGNISILVDGTLTGGKYKVAEYDDADYSDDPKAKVRTHVKQYGFNVEIYQVIPVPKPKPILNQNI